MSEYTDKHTGTGLIKNCEVDGRLVDVRFGQSILAMGDLVAGADESVVDGQGNALLPGLHDQHIHLRALAAHRSSISLAADEVVDPATMRSRLSSVSGEGWLRCVDYHESSLGELKASDLDFISRPVRVQHRSGKLWVLNSVAMDLLAVQEAEHPGVERDSAGQPTGRLFRMDDWLAAKLPAQDQASELRSTVQELLSLGITEITDASYTNRGSDELALREQCHPLRVNCMGVDTSKARKIMLDEDALPDFAELVSEIEREHARDRGVAFHCVSRTELVYLIGVLRAAGSHVGDRIEHGGVIPVELIADIRQLGCAVVTQPGFVASKGDAYIANVPEVEHQDLYRYETLRQAEIPVIASSDAPYGPVNPWRIVASAMDRLTTKGEVLGQTERTSAEAALSGYLRADPKGDLRSLEVGERADFCLLDRTWAQAKNNLAKVAVLGTWIDGERVFDLES